jgi:hypothetical protein
MRKLLNKPWFVAMMAVTALALVAYVYFSQGEKFGLIPAESVSATAEATPDDSPRANMVALVRNLQLPAPIKDPFVIRVKAEVAERPSDPDVVDTVHLSAIWTQDGQTLALINDRICQNGDEIGRLKIESATRDGVWITHWKGRDFISVGGNFTLNTPTSKLSTVAKSL